MDSNPTNHEVQPVAGAETIKDASISSPSQAQPIPTESTGQSQTPPSVSSSEARDASPALPIATASDAKESSSEKRSIDNISPDDVNDSIDTSNKKIKATSDEQMPAENSAFIVHSSSTEAPRNGNYDSVHGSVEPHQNDLPKDELVGTDKATELYSQQQNGDRPKVESVGGENKKQFESQSCSDLPVNESMDGEKTRDVDTQEATQEAAPPDLDHIGGVPSNSPGGMEEEPIASGSTKEMDASEVSPVNNGIVADEVSTKGDCPEDEPLNVAKEQDHLDTVEHHLMDVESTENSTGRIDCPELVEKEPKNDNIGTPENESMDLENKEAKNGIVEPPENDPIDLENKEDSESGKGDLAQGEPLESEAKKDRLNTVDDDPMKIENEEELESGKEISPTDDSIDNGTKMDIESPKDVADNDESAASARQEVNGSRDETSENKIAPSADNEKIVPSQENAQDVAKDKSTLAEESPKVVPSGPSAKEDNSGSDYQSEENPQKAKDSSVQELNGANSSSVPTTTTRLTRRRTRSKSLDDEKEARRVSKESDHPDEIVSEYIKLFPLPSWVAPLPPLSKSELSQLEKIFDIGKSESWRDDWIGNLGFADVEIYCPDVSGSGKGGPKKSLLRWAERGRTSLKVLNNLIRHVCNLDETPPRAKDILGAADETSLVEIQEAIRRVSYDPVVLREDGWTTKKSNEAIGASGGPNRIGEMVFWQGFQGVVIAYIHDHDLGDLWKAMWLEEFDTFDLEAEELEDAKRRYERRMKPKPDVSTKKPGASKQSASGEASSSAAAQVKRSARFAASEDFFVDGIEHGIVLAVSYARGSRPGVFWPARVMHASEMQAYGSQNKRGSQKQKIDVMFLAPYWNSAPVAPGGRRAVESYADSLSRHGESIFNTGPLFEFESIDAVDEGVQQYPYDIERGLDMDQLRVSFKFSGLPKAAFSRFVDSHRLALGLKTFSQTRLKSTLTDLNKATAGLFEAHQLAVHTALFPQAVLHLPFEYILSQMPSPGKDGSVPIYDDMESHVEPALQLGAMLDAMKPPMCWGEDEGPDNGHDSHRRHSMTKAFALPAVPLKLEDGEGTPVKIESFINDLPRLKEALSSSGTSIVSPLLSTYLEQLLSKFPTDQAECTGFSLESRRIKAKDLVGSWALVKAHGEELIGSMHGGIRQSVLSEWRRACERLYRYISQALSSAGFGNGVSSVITDSRCNQHRTSSGCFERAVRLPAAIRAAKQAGAGTSDKIHLIAGLEDKYLEVAEERIIGKAHSKTYLKRIKSRCMAIPVDDNVVPLTEDSDGKGGEDTMGSKGTWMAALAGVGAAIKAVDMIIQGECVNVFCATRPPGHHAGRELHPMKAVSNGFCILNTVACAALYATTPVSADGPGLSRVCVIDIDVHHGNGTQDILCNTYDPRFLYVSIHAGGIDVNGIEPGDDVELTHHLGRTAKRGIFPGRCGDKSPHRGVLNIPLGARVTGHNLGTALITKVTPAVEAFSPELIIISAGFDAHKNDPLNLGGLGSEDFGTLTEVICQMAHKLCSGRVLSVLEGGYGVPCCRPQSNWFLPENVKPLEPSEAPETSVAAEGGGTDSQPDASQKPVTLLDLGEELPSDMKDELPYPLQKRLDKCHAEGFMECVKEHVRTLAKCSERS